MSDFGATRDAVGAAIDALTSCAELLSEAADVVEELGAEVKHASQWVGRPMERDCAPDIARSAAAAAATAERVAAAYARPSEDEEATS